MKIRDILMSLSVGIILCGCFKDEGNYTYLPDSAPVFDFATNQLYCYEGDTTLFEGKFHFETPDSLERMADLSYEWIINGVLISTEKDFHEPTDEVMRKLKLTQFPESFVPGSYRITENKTGLKYIKNMLYNFRPDLGTGNWLILSKNGSNARLSYQQLVQKNNGNRIDTTYKNYVAFYKEKNEDKELTGTPRFLLDHVAPNISSYAGATLVVTDKEVCEISNESIKKVQDIKEEFLNGVPEDFVVKDAYYVNQYSFLATDNGKLYRRELSENYLGGKFISDPYVVDEKGYEIDFFANGRTATSTGIRLCYDRKNHRILLINQWYTPMASIKLLEQTGTGHSFTPWDLGKDVEVLAISEIGAESENYGYNGGCFYVVYNQNGKTYLGSFYIDHRPPSYYGRVINNSYMRIEESPVYLTKDNLIRLTSTGYYNNGFAKYILYSKGNEIRYINRINLTEGLLIGNFADRVTTFRFDIRSNNHKELGVGLANGDFMRVNVRNMEAAEVFVKSKFNVGGEIVDISMTGGRMYYEE